MKKSEKEIFVAAQLSHTPMDVFYLKDSTEVEELKKYPVLIVTLGFWNNVGGYGEYNHRI